MQIVVTIIFQIFGNFRESEIWRKFVFNSTIYTNFEFNYHECYCSDMINYVIGLSKAETHNSSN